MRYEDCSQHLLTVLSDLADAKRAGTFVEIGLGTANYGFIDAVRNGFQALAVEALPSERLVLACREHHVPLETSAVSDKDGWETMHLGQFRGQPNVNLSSLQLDWWGSSSVTRRVPSLTLASLLKKCGIRRMAVLKLDVEGSEFSVTSGLDLVPSCALPDLVQLEYGGGGTRSSQQGGWYPKYLDFTCSALELLRSLGYACLLLVDRDRPSVGSFRLDTVRDFKDVFHPLAHVGNAILCKQGSLRRYIDLVGLSHAYADTPRTRRSPTWSPMSPRRRMVSRLLHKRLSR